jgi:hypothetical protein
MPQLLTFALILPLLTGCASSLAGGDKVMKFRADDPPILGKVHHAGDYVVVYRPHGDDDLWQAKGTRRTLKKGDDLGFDRDDAGRLIAIAGDQERTLGPIPVIAQYACWYRLPDNYDDTRQFRKNAHTAAGAVAQTADTVARTAVIGGAILGPAALLPDSDETEDSDGWTDRKSHHRKR